MDKNPFSFVTIIMEKYEWAVYIGIIILIYWIALIMYKAVSSEENDNLLEKK